MPTIPYTGQVPVALSDFLGVQPYVGLFGAVPDCRRVSDASIVAGQTKLVSPTANWGLGAVDGSEWGPAYPLAGKYIAVAGAGPDGADLITTIASWTNPGEIELATPAVTNVSEVACIWGTDNTAGLQSAFDIFAAKGVVLRLHFGEYLTGPLVIPAGLHLIGSGRASALVQKPGTAASNTDFLGTAISTGAYCEDIVFEHLRIDGTRTWQDLSIDLLSNALLRLLTVENVTVRHCIFENAVGMCIWGRDIKHAYFEHSKFRNWAPGVFSGFSIHDRSDLRTYLPAPAGHAGSEDFHISHCHFDGSVSHSSCIGVGGEFLHPPHDFTIHHNTVIVGNGKLITPNAGTLGIEVWGLSSGAGEYGNNFYDYSIDHNSVVCESVNNLAYGISIGGSIGHSGAITGNKVKRCEFISIEASDFDLICSGNTIEDCAILVINGSGAGTSGQLVTANKIRSPLGTAIQLFAQKQANDSNQPYVENATISNNSIELTREGSTGIDVQVAGPAEGITTPPLDGYMRNIHILGNKVTGNGSTAQAGITMSRYAGEISGCLVQDNNLKNLADGIVGLITGCGIRPDDTDGRYIANTFTNVDTPYLTTHDSSTKITDIYGEHFAAESYQVRSQGAPVIDAAGNVALVGQNVKLSSRPIASTHLVNTVALNDYMDLPANQGGMISVNSYWAGYPNWAQSSLKFSCTASASTNRLTADADIFQIFVWVLNDGSGLPGGLAENTPYYMINVVGNTFQLSLTITGSPIDITSNGTCYATYCPYAMFMLMAPLRWGLRFGDATNVDGTNPGQFAIRVERGTASEYGSFENNISLYWPLHIISSDGAFDRTIEVRGSSPEGVLNRGLGSLVLAHYDDQGHLFLKYTGADATGWIDIGNPLWQLIGDVITTEFRPRLTHSSYDANRPVVLDGDKEMDTDIPLDAAWIANGSVSNDEFQRLNGVTSDIQTQITALDARIDALEGGGVDISGLVTKAQHNAHTHFYTGDGTAPSIDSTSTASPTLS